MSWIPGTYLVQQKVPIFGNNLDRARLNYLAGNNLLGLTLLGGLMTILKDVWEAGDDEEGWHMTGPMADATPQDRQRLLSAGIDRLSFWRRMPDGTVQSVGYKNTPFAGLLAAVGSMSDERRFKPERWAKHGPAGHALRALVIGATQFMELASLQGLMDVLGVSKLRGGGDAGATFVETVNKQAARYAGGYIPTILKDAEAWADPRYFRPETAAQEWVRNVPLARRYVADGRPALNLLGEEIELKRAPWNRTFKSIENTEAARVAGTLLARGVVLPVPSGQKMVVRGGKRVKISDLGPAAEYAYIKAVGQGYAEFLRSEAGGALLALPPERAAKRLDAVTEIIRARAVRAVP
jgi:hypothetical protein